jgi:hypothetical protein
MNQGVYPNSLSFHCFHFGLKVKSIKELGGMLVMVMGGAFCKGGSWEIIRLIITISLQMEDVCILYNVIENFLWKKITKTKKGGPFRPFKF